MPKFDRRSQLAKDGYVKNAVMFTSDMGEKEIFSIIKNKFLDKLDGNVPSFKIMRPYGSKLVSPNLDGEWTYKVLKHQCGNGPLYVCPETIKVHSDSEDENLYEPFDVIIESIEVAKQQSAMVTTATQEEVTVTCPICQQKVPSTEIQVHANNCAEQSINCQTQDDYASIVWNVTPHVIPEDNNSDHEVQINDECKIEADVETLRAVIKEDVSVLRKDETECRLNIRRLKAWHDYVAFFKKPWNRHKRHHTVSVTFLGEAAIDTGGPKREFFSGIA